MRRSYRSEEYVFFFNDTATTEIYTLSLHDALPIWLIQQLGQWFAQFAFNRFMLIFLVTLIALFISEVMSNVAQRSEEHTSELQSRQYLVCRLLLEKKNFSLFQSLCPQFLLALPLHS